MKKKLLIFISVFFTLTTFAQTLLNSNDHLTFKGVPIDGSLDSFAEKLKATGLEEKERGDDWISFAGSFAGYAACDFYAYGTKGAVCKVVALMTTENNFIDARNEYDSFKEAFTKKFNVNPTCTEQLESSKTATSEYLSSSFKSKASVWRSVFMTTKGIVVISINYANYDCFQVVLEYYDKINGDKRSSDMMNDI